MLHAQITSSKDNGNMKQLLRLQLLPPASEGWGKVLFSVCLSVHISGGGGSRSGGGLPSLRSQGGPSLRSGGGAPRSRSGSGGPSLRSGGGYPVSVKGKFFDTRFGLIHVQTGKKIFVKGPSPPPTPIPSKGKNF